MLNCSPSWLPSPLFYTVLCASLLSCGQSTQESSLIKSVSVPAQAAGDVVVSFTLFDAEAVPVDVVLEYSLDGGATWQTGSVTEPTALFGLATSGEGVTHTVVWDSIADIGFRVEDAKVRVRTVAEAGGGSGDAEVRLSSLSAAADRVESHMIHLGAFDAATVAVAQSHKMVVVNPAEPTVTKEIVAEIQAGVDAGDPSDDVIVLGYVFVGEDIRTIGKSDAELLLDTRFVGDGTGPRIDPRGGDADGSRLTELPALGSAAVGGGYASWYLDDNSVDANGTGDGKPDRNAASGACFVNAGDPAWFAVLDTSLIDGPNRIAGIREIVSSDFGRGFGCDGVFLSGMDTCAPNFYTSGADPVQSEFEWTAGGYRDFIERVRTSYPGHVIAQNRGLFFYDTNLPHFSVRPGAFVDFVVFESFRLDRSSLAEFDPYFFANNKFNLAPKLQAEAYRDQGFQVLSLGYAEGPGIDAETLVGMSTTGQATLLEDIEQAQTQSGFRHYLTSATGLVANSFVLENSNFNDTTAPVWTSTAGSPSTFPTPPTAATARVGVQELAARYRAAVLRWDVAMDLNPVSYVVYYNTGEGMWFYGDQPYRTTRVEVTPRVGAGYEFGAGVETFPYEVVIDGLVGGYNYTFLVRAIDSVGNEDTNRVVRAVRTLSRDLEIEVDGKFSDWKSVATIHRDGKDSGNSAGPDWRSIRIVNDDTNLYIYFSAGKKFNVDGSPSYTFSRTLMFIDVDASPTTGWTYGTVGSDLLVSGDKLFTQEAGTFNTGEVATLAYSPMESTKACEVAIPLAELDKVRGGAAYKVRLVFINDETWDVAPDTGHIEFEIQR